MAGVENVIVLGGSNEIGYGLPDRNGWVQQLKHHFFTLHQRNPHATFTELAHPGDTIETFYNRVITEVKSRVSQRRRTLAILAINGQELWGRRTIPDSLDDYGLHGMAGSISKTVRLLVRQGSVLAVGPTPVREESGSLYGLPRSTPSANRALIWLDRLAYDEVKGSGAGDGSPHSVRYVSPWDELSGRTFAENIGDSLLQRDGVHLNADGHEWLFRTTLPDFEMMIGSAATRGAVET